MKRRASTTVAQLIADQEAWIENHGGDLAGYVARYGSASDPDHYGNGGEAIYKADTDALHELRTDNAHRARRLKGIREPRQARPFCCPLNLCDTTNSDECPHWDYMD